MISINNASSVGEIRNIQSWKLKDRPYVFDIHPTEDILAVGCCDGTFLILNKNTGEMVYENKLFS